MNQTDWTAWQTASLDRCDPDSLPDIRRIAIDRSQPVPQRMADFLSAIGNPYLFKVGEVVVKVSFTPDGKPFSQALSDAICAC